MLKLLLYILCMSPALDHFADWTQGATVAKLEILIEDISEAHGTIYVCLSDRDEHFGTRCVASATITVISTDIQMAVLSDLHPGEYAISIFHDLNENGILDTNRLGIPNEPFGFSLNPRILFRKPGFASCSFEVVTGRNQQMVRLRKL